MIEMLVDLFGQPDLGPTPPWKTARTLIGRTLAPLNYRRAEGPRCCGNCQMHVVKKYARRYHKCLVLGDTCSNATDVRLRNTCDAWRGESYGDGR